MHEGRSETARSGIGPLAAAAGLVRTARNIAVLTGAGVSAESGVPTFRGAGGLWRGRRAEDLATPLAFRRDPEQVWDFYRWRMERLDGVEPNAGHFALAALGRWAERFWLITQNVDGLHTAAGSREVIELHGSLRTARCRTCPYRCPMLEASTSPLPECPRCGDLLRPAVVWFGEALPEDALAAAGQAIAGCSLMLVVGTSGVVEPASSFAALARRRGARIVEINLEPTPISRAANVSIFGRSGEILPDLVGLVTRGS
jgi:NAD-dependent deacetylase